MVIRVQDNGEGMPPERVERILSGFAEESEQNGRKSTGIVCETSGTGCS